VSSSPRKLRVVFKNAEAFQKEYASNLLNGGIFVATEDELELRDRVSVVLVAQFSRQKVKFEGEVVHRVTPEMAQMGAEAGVAVQFDDPVTQVRAKLQPLRMAEGATEPAPADDPRRRAPRAPARVPARIDSSVRSFEGHTRDLSRNGVLVALSGEGPPVGEKVGVLLTEPESGEQIVVQGIVTRRIEKNGIVSAVGIEFAPGEGQRDGMERFVDDVQNVEHNRRLGGITGDISELGIHSLLQMFASTAKQGTLAIHRAEEEGLIGFDGGLMRFVKIGAASGMKALVRLMTWEAGSFEFHARLDPIQQSDVPLPVDAAMLEAVRMIDEGRLLDAGRFPGEATPQVDNAADVSGLSKLEAAVVDLARAGFTVQRMVDVIPEPDPEIYRALESLLDGGVLAF